MSQIISIISHRLRNYRLERGLTQEKLAEKAGLHYTYVGQVERGEKNLTLASLEKILMALDVSFAELFYGLEDSLEEESTAAKCYDLIKSKNIEEQNIIYQILCSIDDLLNR
jgi:transcriptional regulator with XRE-family HTH domain